MHRRTRAARGARGTAAVLGMVATVALTGCGADGGGPTTDADGVTSLTAGVSVTTFTLGEAYYTSLPRYLGYFDDAGLDVTTRGFDGSGEVVTALATDRIDIAHAGNYSTMAAHVNGGATTTTFMQDIPGSPYFPIVLEDSPIQTLADMEGTTFGIFSTASDANKLLAGIMAQRGLAVSEVDIVATGVGATAAEALRSGQIDGWMAYDTGAAILTTLGIRWRAVEPEVFAGYGPGSGMSTSRETLETQREVLVAYGQAVARSMVFMAENPAAAVQVHWEVYPDTRPAGVDPEEALTTAVAELEGRLVNVFPDDAGQWGGTDDQRFQDYIDVFVAAGVLRDDVALDEIWTDELIADINDFDVAAVQAQARDFQLAD